MIIFVFFFIAILMLWITFPVLSQQSGTAQTEDRAMLAERAESLQRSLKDLQDSRERGTLADDDYRNIENRMMVTLARAYDQLGIAPDKAETDAKPASDEASCNACGQSLTSQYKYCPACGEKSLAA